MGLRSRWRRQSSSSCSAQKESADAENDGWSKRRCQCPGGEHILVTKDNLYCVVPSPRIPSLEPALYRTVFSGESFGHHIRWSIQALHQLSEKPNKLPRWAALLAHTLLHKIKHQPPVVNNGQHPNASCGLLPPDLESVRIRRLMQRWLPRVLPRPELHHLPDLPVVRLSEDETTGSKNSVCTPLLLPYENSAIEFYSSQNFYKKIVKARRGTELICPYSHVRFVISMCEGCEDEDEVSQFLLTGVTPSLKQSYVKDLEGEISLARPTHDKHVQLRALQSCPRAWQPGGPFACTAFGTEYSEEHERKCDILCNMFSTMRVGEVSRFACRETTSKGTTYSVMQATVIESVIQICNLDDLFVDNCTTEHERLPFSRNTCGRPPVYVVRWNGGEFASDSNAFPSCNRDPKHTNDKVTVCGKARPSWSVSSTAAESFEFVNKSPGDLPSHLLWMMYHAPVNMPCTLWVFDPYNRKSSPSQINSSPFLLCEEVIWTSLTQSISIQSPVRQILREFIWSNLLTCVLEWSTAMDVVLKCVVGSRRDAQCKRLLDALTNTNWPDYDHFAEALASSDGVMIGSSGFLTTDHSAIPPEYQLLDKTFLAKLRSTPGACFCSCHAGFYMRSPLGGRRWAFYVVSATDESDMGGYVDSLLQIMQKHTHVIEAESNREKARLHTEVRLFERFYRCKLYKDSDAVTEEPTHALVPLRLYPPQDSITSTTMTPAETSFHLMLQTAPNCTPVYCTLVHLPSFSPSLLQIQEMAARQERFQSTAPLPTDVEGRRRSFARLLRRSKDSVNATMLPPRVCQPILCFSVTESSTKWIAWSGSLVDCLRTTSLPVTRTDSHALCLLTIFHQPVLCVRFYTGSVENSISTLARTRPQTSQAPPSESSTVVGTHMGQTTSPVHASPTIDNNQVQVAEAITAILREYISSRHCDLLQKFSRNASGVVLIPVPDDNAGWSGYPVIPKIWRLWTRMQDLRRQQKAAAQSESRESRKTEVKLEIVPAVLGPTIHSIEDWRLASCRLELVRLYRELSAALLTAMGLQRVKTVSALVTGEIDGLQRELTNALNVAFLTCLNHVPLREIISLIDDITRSVLEGPQKLLAECIRIWGTSCLLSGEELLIKKNPSLCLVNFRRGCRISDPDLCKKLMCLSTLFNGPKGSDPYVDDLYEDLISNGNALSRATVLNSLPHHVIKICRKLLQEYMEHPLSNDSGHPSPAEERFLFSHCNSPCSSTRSTAAETVVLQFWGKLEWYRAVWATIELPERNDESSFNFLMLYHLGCGLAALLLNHPTQAKDALIDSLAMALRLTFQIPELSIVQNEETSPACLVLCIVISSLLASLECLGGNSSTAGGFWTLTRWLQLHLSMTERYPAIATLAVGPPQLIPNLGAHQDDHLTNTSVWTELDFVSGKHVPDTDTHQFPPEDQCAIVLYHTFRPAAVRDFFASIQFVVEAPRIVLGWAQHSGPVVDYFITTLSLSTPLCTMGSNEQSGVLGVGPPKACPYNEALGTLDAYFAQANLDSVQAGTDVWITDQACPVIDLSIESFVVRTEEKTLPERSHQSPRQMEYEITQVSAGHYHSLLLLTDGSLIGMGSTREGQLGSLAPFALNPVSNDGCDTEERLLRVLRSRCVMKSTTQRKRSRLEEKANEDFHLPWSYLRPVHITIRGIGRITQIGCGADYSVLLTETGELYSLAARGTVGVDSSHESLSTTTSASQHPCRYDCITRIFPPCISVHTFSCGPFHTAVVTTERRLFVWGRNDAGQLSLTPTTVSLSEKVVFSPQEVCIWTMTDAVHSLTAFAEFLRKRKTGGKKVYLFSDVGTRTVVITCSADFTDVLDKAPMLKRLKFLDVACGEGHTLALVDVPTTHGSFAHKAILSEERTDSSTPLSGYRRFILGCGNNSSNQVGLSQKSSWLDMVNTDQSTLLRALHKKLESLNAWSAAGAEFHHVFTTCAQRVEKLIAGGSASGLVMPDDTFFVWGTNDRWSLPVRVDQGTLTEPVHAAIKSDSAILSLRLSQSGPSSIVVSRSGKVVCFGQSLCGALGPLSAGLSPVIWELTCPMNRQKYFARRDQGNSTVTPRVLTLPLPAKAAAVGLYHTTILCDSTAGCFPSSPRTPSPKQKERSHDLATLLSEGPKPKILTESIVPSNTNVFVIPAASSYKRGILPMSPNVHTCVDRATVLKPTVEPAATAPAAPVLAAGTTLEPLKRFTELIVKNVVEKGLDTVGAWLEHSPEHPQKPPPRLRSLSSSPTSLRRRPPPSLESSTRQRRQTTSWRKSMTPNDRTSPKKSGYSPGATRSFGHEKESPLGRWNTEGQQIGRQTVYVDGTSEVRRYESHVGAQQFTADGWRARNKVQSDWGTTSPHTPVSISMNPGSPTRDESPPPPAHVLRRHRFGPMVSSLEMDGVNATSSDSSFLASSPEVRGGETPPPQAWNRPSVSLGH